MRRIIRGKRYDTDRAKLVAANSSDEAKSDFRYWHEDLYRTKHGRWFVHGQGGAMTRWARACGDSTWTGGEGIRPMSDDEAKQWLEDAGELAVLEEMFSESVEDA